MANTVSFGMCWQVYDRQTIDLPDWIDPNSEELIKDYIRSVWKDIPLPGPGEYVDGSDEFDEESPLEIYRDPSVPEPKSGIIIQDNEAGFLAIDRLVRVELENLDEGLCGDYNPEDPNDINFLRFTVSIVTPDGWEQVDDASYCTQLPADTPKPILKRALLYLLKEYSNVLNSNPQQSVKKMGETLSWISPEWFTKEEEV